ncbi:hypothetical protein RCL_jg24339.t1 [Rhizophagus clarus]|uniref:Uncharacterized protein n=1 Tax=Rhizophagus clarus TaxID=94130 RepID=A0A8H3MJM5_9GLOM|nr:hypothetical protein RCL_jg24339.t1 [Rhizophagus clarus]
MILILPKNFGLELGNGENFDLELGNGEDFGLKLENGEDFDLELGNGDRRMFLKGKRVFIFLYKNVLV